MIKFGLLDTATLTSVPCPIEVSAVASAQGTTRISSSQAGTRASTRSLRPYPHPYPLSRLHHHRHHHHQASTPPERLDPRSARPHLVHSKDRPIALRTPAAGTTGRVQYHHTNIRRAYHRAQRRLIPRGCHWHRHRHPRGHLCHHRCHGAVDTSDRAACRLGGRTSARAATGGHGV